MVGSAHHLAIMLDYDNRISPVAQSLQCGNKPLIVARMQTDSRLVKNIEYAG